MEPKKQSKYLGYTTFELEKTLKNYKHEIKLIEYAIKDHPPELLGGYYNRLLTKYYEQVEQIEELLKPKVDYEDGSWV